MNKRTKSILIILTICASLFAMTVPIVATESTGEYGMGYIPPEETPHQESDDSGQPLLSATTYPESYDSRDQDWWQSAGIGVKNQSSTGLCWAFATCTASEISYAKESNGATISALSPGHLGYFAYNRSTTLTDPLGNTKGDYVGGTSQWYSVGGNADIAVQVLAGRTGYASATVAPYENWVGNPTSFKSYDSSIAYTDEYVLENANAYYDTDGFSQDLIKGLITEYGGVYCSISYTDGYYTTDSKGDTCLYYNGRGYANHAVTMIGWDDNYDKKNFDSKHRPSSNGAWLIQNSWGSSNTYIWVSYEDAVVNDDITAFDLRAADEDEVVFEHDGTGAWAYKECTEGDKLANTYAVPEGKNYTLKEVGIGEYNDATTNYTISVYTNLPDRTAAIPSGATPAVTFSATTTCEGYHTFKLPTEVELQGGTNYSIVVTVDSNSAYMAVDQQYTIESKRYGTVTFQPTAEAGDSYYYDADYKSWNDLSEERTPSTARIKGIAVEKNQSNTYKLYGSINTSCEDGVSVEVVDSNATKHDATVSGSTYSCQDLEAGDYTVTISGSGNYISREYQVSLTEDYEQDLTLLQLGDADGDGLLKAADVTRIARHLANIDVEGDGYMLKLFNTDRQGDKPGAEDVTHLARYLAGIISAL